MEFIIFLLLAAEAFAVWRFIKRVHWGAQMGHPTRTGDPMLMDLHAHHKRMDWYSLDAEMRAAVAADFQRDPNRV